MTKEELREAIENIIDDYGKCQGESYNSETGDMEYFDYTDAYAASVKIVELISKVTGNPPE